MITTLSAVLTFFYVTILQSANKVRTCLFFAYPSFFAWRLQLLGWETNFMTEAEKLSSQSDCTGAKICFLLKALRPGMGSTQLSISRSLSFSLGIKRPVCEDDYSPSSSAYRDDT
jgi:hypothetical protein